MSDYHSILIVSMLRMLPACAILFAALPAMLFPAFPSKSLAERVFGMALFMGTLTIVMTHVFVLLKINDNVSIVIVCLWIIGFKWWLMYRRKHIGFVLIKSVLLRWIEIVSRPSIVKRFGITMSFFWKREIIIRMIYLGTFLAICAAAVVIRIGPLWEHPAPLSPEYYETLEQVKRLQINQVQPGTSRMLMGMPAVISALCTAAQVDPTIAVHYFGLISAILLCGSMYFTIFTSVRSRIEAAIGTAVLACAYAFLPVSVDHQIEADSLTLALVFLLPSLTFLMHYAAHGNFMRLLAALSGLAACALINLFAGCAGFFAAAAILCSSFFILPSLPRLRGRTLALHAGLTVLLGLMACAMWMYAYDDAPLQSVLQIIFYDTHFYRYANLGALPEGWFLQLCAGMFVLLIAAAFIPRTRKEWHMHLIGWGATGMLFLVMIPPFAAGLPETLPGAQTVFLLSVVAAAAVGLSAGIFLDLFEWTMAKVRFSPALAVSVRTSLAMCVFASVIMLFPGTPAAVGSTAEPDGFAQNLYAIQRTYIPYQWTIVAHRGILLAGMNRGRFLDYDYFTALYDPVTYRHGTRGAIPTALVFIFVEKSSDATGIASELAPLDKDAMRRARQWCETYIRTHDDMSVYYSDDSIIIYQLRDPSVASQRM